MLKVEIKLDEEKIQEENKYTIEGVRNAIYKAFGKYEFPREELEDGTICFYGKGRRNDYARFGLLITSLKDEEWFVSNLAKWLWFNSDRGRDEEDYSIEDILHYFTKKESVV